MGLAEDGFDIAVVYAGSADAARETCEACEAAGVTARAYQCDVADPAAVNTCVETVLNDFGSILVSSSKPLFGPGFYIAIPPSTRTTSPVM